MILQRMRTDLEAIFQAAVKAADPKAAVRRHLVRRGNSCRIGEHVFCLDDYERIFVVGAGKAAAVMASAVEEILGDRIAGGIVNVKYGHAVPLERVTVQEAGHPIPDENGVHGAERIATIARQTTERDMILALFSGGGSALMPLPAEGISLEEKQAVTRELLACGATIRELNAIRKHLSVIKGGQLARLAAPARVVALLLSDVVGDPLDVIASGPTVPDQSTFADCLGILSKYRLVEKIPPNVLRHLQEGAAGHSRETPKAHDPVFERVTNLVVANNAIALEAAAQKAASLGWHPLILTSTIEGEAREVGRAFASILREAASTGRPVAPPACILCGGETTVTLRGNGTGGRNQELALSAAIALEGTERISLLAAGTDGTDGPTDAAGAFADGTTSQRAHALGLDPREILSKNDSYTLFQALGDLLITGPTGTNVMDIYIGLVCPK